MNDSSRSGLFRRGWILVILMGNAVHCSEPDEYAPAPALARVQLFSDRAYFLTGAETRTRTPMLVEYPLGRLTSDHSERCLRVFGTPSEDSPQLNQRWSAFPGGIYCTLYGMAIMRYRQDDLDILAASCSNADVPPAVRPDYARSITNYAMLDPVVSARHRFVRDSSNSPRLLTKTPVVFYDLRALDSDKVDLYMTTDGDLTSWRYDGKAWKKLKHYNLRVESEFLVFNAGRSLISERDGKWAVVHNLENDDTSVEPVVDRIEGQPLILIEDTTDRANYFVHRESVLDDHGQELKQLEPNVAQRDRIREAIDFVISIHRE